MDANDDPSDGCELRIFEKKCALGTCRNHGAKLGAQCSGMILMGLFFVRSFLSFNVDFSSSIFCRNSKFFCWISDIFFVGTARVKNNFCRIKF